MNTVLPKKSMSEEDIKLQYITPAITSKWDSGKITMETQVTDGKINLKGNFVFREKPKRADYILYLEKGQTIFAVDIETLREEYRLVTGERYKINLLRPERVIHVEEGTYGTKALVKHTHRSVYDKEVTVSIPTIEELIYFMTKRGK